MEFAYPHLNPIAILVAALAQFVLGWLWYANVTPTGKMWLAAQSEAVQGHKPGAEMLTFPISAIFAAWAVAMVYGWSGAVGPMDGVLAAWVVALALIAQTVAQGVASMHSTSIITLTATYQVVGYALMGAIIGVLA
jgi:hypothetical protein